MAALDLTTLVPRIRRALDAETLPEAAAVAAAADAIARIILYTGSFFGHTLEVTNRDATFGAPDQWELSDEPTQAELEVVAIQAALDHITKSANELTQQTIRSEGREWSWQKSASALTERVRLLKEERDRALEVIEDGQGGSLVHYVAFLHTADLHIDRMLREPALLGFDDRFGGS